MDKRGRKLGSVLRTSVVLISILVGIFAEGSWAQAQPNIISQFPPPGPPPNNINILINTQIRIQFNMTMTGGMIELEDEEGKIVAGTTQWVQTTVPNDTLIFTPTKGLKPATGYSYEGWASSGTGFVDFEASFLTKHSLADATPPEVQTTYPYNGMTNFRTSDSIYIVFSEAMNPGSITAAGNITLTGNCMGGATDYIVMYHIGDGEAEIKKATPFVAGQSCTVNVTPNVRDLRGNPLKNQYSFSFQTGAADTTDPSVIQTIPADGDTNVSRFPNFYAIFSEEMDEPTLMNPAHYTLYDITASASVPIFTYWSSEDVVSFGAQSGLTEGHYYSVTIGTGVKDRAGRSLTPKTWYFTAAGPGQNSDPTIGWGLNRDAHIGQRFSDGINPSITQVLLELGAHDYDGNPVTVTTTTPKNWILTGVPGTWGWDYYYESGGTNENLSSGNHIVRFRIQDGVNTVTFERNIYIFDASPTLLQPASGATGVSTTPTFTWSYSGSERPFFYDVAVFDGPNMDTDNMVWSGAIVDKGSSNDPHSITIPADKKLSPNKPYYWGVRGVNREENGETLTGLWPFTTVGTPPPPARFQRPWPRSENIYPPALQGRLSVLVFGPSPADIVELKVTGPGGFQYIFTEDDLVTSESLGQYYAHSFANPLVDGTYTFSLTDSAGRIFTTTKDFTYAFVPRVDYTTMVPGDNAYVNTTTPTLSWDSVPGANYYRVFIWDWNSGQPPVYASDFIQDTSIIIPSGVLFPNASYNWRVDVFDSPYGSNSSRSNTLQFSTGSSTYTPNIVWGYVWNDNNYYFGAGKFMGALVLDTLPDEVIQLRVTWPSGGLYDFTQSNILYHLSLAQGNLYTVFQPGPTTDGNYNFNLQTPRGTDTYGPHGQTSTTITIVDQGSMVPVNNAYINSLTPTLSWTALGGGPWYYRVMIQDWRNKYIIYSSATSTNTSLTIPDGVLEPNRSYMWRVEVFDNANTIAADNRSTSGWNCFTTPRPTLVDHYYTSILKRTPDPGGKAYWEGEVERTQTLGIDIKEAYMVMSGNFFNSAEYLGFGRTDEEFLTDLYLTFFNRDPDPGGFSYWLGELAAGATRDMVMYFFMFSPEFFDFMSDRFGDTTTRAEIYPVVDFYRGFMNRLPDDGGFVYWLGRFRTAQCTGAPAIIAEADAISSLFLGSPEYIGRARTNSQYVQDLYYAFMRRYAVYAEEVAYWVGELNSGAKNREWLRQFFLQSPEFTGRVDAMIAQGCYSP